MMLQLRQQVLMLMTEILARLQKLTDIVYLQQQRCCQLTACLEPCTDKDLLMPPRQVVL